MGAINVWNGSTWTSGKSFKIWNGSTWVLGCPQIWNGSQWVPMFDNGTVSAGTGGNFVSPIAVSDANSSAGNELQFLLNTASPSVNPNNISIRQVRAGTISPSNGSGSFFEETTLLSTQPYNPTPCSPLIPALSARLTLLSGDAPTVTTGLNTWKEVSASGGISFILTASVARANNFGGQEQFLEKTSTFRFELALTSNTDDVRASADYSFTVSARSIGIEN